MMIAAHAAHALSHLQYIYTTANTALKICAICERGIFTMVANFVDKVRRGKYGVAAHFIGALYRMCFATLCGHGILIIQYAVVCGSPDDVCLCVIKYNLCN